MEIDKAKDLAAKLLSQLKDEFPSENFVALEKDVLNSHVVVAFGGPLDYDSYNASIEVRKKGLFNSSYWPLAKTILILGAEPKKLQDPPTYDSNITTYQIKDSNYASPSLIKLLEESHLQKPTPKSEPKKPFYLSTSGN